MRLLYTASSMVLLIYHEFETTFADDSCKLRGQDPEQASLQDLVSVKTLKRFK